MTPLSSFLPYILPSAPGCLPALAERTVRDICIDFCSKSLIVQKTLDPVSAVADIAEYDFDLDAGYAVVMIMQAWYGVKQLTAINADQARVEVFNNQFPSANTSSGTPSRLIVKDGETFTLDFPPQEDGTNLITVRAALKPTRDATEVDDLLFNDYAYEIGQGALSRLLRMAKKPYTDPVMAAVCEREYAAARNAAQVRANKMFGRSEERVMPGVF